MKILLYTPTIPHKYNQELLFGPIELDQFAQAVDRLIFFCDLVHILNVNREGVRKKPAPGLVFLRRKKLTHNIFL